VPEQPDGSLSQISREDFSETFYFDPNSKIARTGLENQFARFFVDIKYQIY
jgi:hypothetical protein